jgi:hypothetical protein
MTNSVCLLQAFTRKIRTSTVSESRSRRYGRANIRRRHIRRKVVWAIPHSRGERCSIGRNRAFSLARFFFHIFYNRVLQDLDQEDDVPLRQVDYKQLDDYYRQDIAAKKQREEAKAKILYEQKGFCKEGGEGDGY